METVRFIPAGAGNSLVFEKIVFLRWFIPAGAGNSIIVVDKCRCYCGLSPLARGTHSRQSLKINEIGLSPLARGTPGIKK